MARVENPSRIPWAWIGCGCAVVLVGVLMVVGGAAWFGVRTFQQIETELEDPEARRAKALEVLRTDRLPEPFEPILALEIPFFLEMAALSDGSTPEGEPEPHDLQADRLLLFLRVRDFGGDQRPKIRSFLDGDSSELDLDMNMDVDLDVTFEETIGSGAIDLDQGSRVLWRADRCAYSGEGGRALEGVHVLFLGDCPIQDHVDFGIWVHPAEQAPEVSRVEADLADLLDGVVVCPER